MIGHIVGILHVCLVTSRHLCGSFPRSCYCVIKNRGFASNRLVMQATKHPGGSTEEGGLLSF